jgi:hypothetical protein
VHPGEALALDVHVVSDLRTPITGVVVEATVGWADGSHTRRWTGNVPADECVRIGTLSIVVPEGPGPLTIDLRMGESTSSYVATVSGS